MLASAAQHPSSDGLRRRGRVPSFYTSRSIVNLSGLNGKLSNTVNSGGNGGRGGGGDDDGHGDGDRTFLFPVFSEDDALLSTIVTPAKGKWLTHLARLGFVGGREMDSDICIGFTALGFFSLL